MNFCGKVGGCNRTPGPQVANAFECAKLAVRAGLSSFLLGMYFYYTGPG